MAKDKVKSHVRRTKKGVARVTGHARKNKKGIAITGGVLGLGAIIGGAVALKKGAGKNLLKKHGKKANTVITNTAQEITGAAGAVPKLTQEKFNQAQKAAMSGGVSLSDMDIRSSPGVGLTQAQRGVAMIPVNKPTMSNASMKTPIGKAGKKVVEAGKATVALGKETRKAFNDGLNNPGTGGSYQVGRNIFGGVKNVASTVDALVKRATKKRGK